MSDNLKIKVISDSGVRVFIPRDDAGRFQAQDDVNDHALARRASDVGAEALGFGPMTSGLHLWNRRNTPSCPEVAESLTEAAELGRRVSRRLNTGNGRGAAFIDFQTPAGVGINVKMVGSTGHAAFHIHKPPQALLDTRIKEAAMAPLWGLQVSAEMVDGFYLLDSRRMMWKLTDCAAAIRAAGGDAASLLACARPGGRPRNGEVLPPAWAGGKGVSRYAPIMIRGLDLGATGWSTGTLADLRREVLALR
jgi:hypothetical protein